MPKPKPEIFIFPNDSEAIYHPSCEYVINSDEKKFIVSREGKNFFRSFKNATLLNAFIFRFQNSNKAIW